MANTLTDLIPHLYAAMNTVSREQIGFISAVTLDSSAERVALGQSIVSPVTPEAYARDITPAVTPPNDGDQVIGNRALTMTKSRGVPVRWNGEQALGIDNGPGMGNVVQEQFAQAMRTLCNEMEQDLAALHISASLAYGVAGTTPFAVDLSDTANIRKLLLDNGTQASDLQLVMNTTAGVNIMTLDQLNKVNEAGDDNLLRQGALGKIHGMELRESAQIKTHTKGTGAGYLVNNVAGYSVDSTVIDVDIGTGTILAGDIVTFAGDTRKYVVAEPLSNGAITLAAPGIQKAIADNTAITIGENFIANMAFSRSSMVLATRAPALPGGRDMAEDRITIVDPISGLSFEISVYLQYRQLQYEVAMAWGIANFKPESTVILLG